MRLGQRTPYHAAASARAILAFQEPAEQRRLLEGEPFEPFTDKTPSNLHDAGAALALTRARGYAVCDEEMEVGVAAVSVPVVGIDGVIDASLTLVAPYDRLAPSARYAAACVLAEASLAIANDLGFNEIDVPRLPIPVRMGWQASTSRQPNLRSHGGRREGMRSAGFDSVAPGMTRGEGGP